MIILQKYESEGLFRTIDLIHIKQILTEDLMTP